MKITYDLDLNTFQAWSGAVSTLDRIRLEGKTSDLEFLLEDIYPEGMTETQLNDLLWFEPDWIFESLGMRTESQIEEEIQELEERLEEINDGIQELMEEKEEDGLDTEEEIKELMEEAQDIQEQINDLKEELRNI